MNKRVFILGAGFSKAIAAAPLVNEFVGRIYEKAIENVKGKPESWYASKNSFLHIIKVLESSVEHGLKFLENDGTKIQNRSGIELISSINIEHLCTLLDLNIDRPFIPKGDGVDLQGCPIPFMTDMYVHDLEAARKFIIHHIIEFLLPDSLNVDEVLLLKFANFIKPGDVVLTFNYDLLIEQALWRLEKWSPLGGYLIGKIDDYLKVKPANIHKTKVPVIKLHGSVNWREPSIFDDDVIIFLTHPLTHDLYFDGFEFEFKVKRESKNRLLDSFLITPTFMKNFKSKYDLELIRFAINSVRDCSEIFSLGYSFQEADCLTYFLISQIPTDTRINIIDLNAKEISERLGGTYGINKENIIPEQSKIEDWIKSDFQFIEFEKYKEEQEIFEQISSCSEK